MGNRCCFFFVSEDQPNRNTPATSLALLPERQCDPRSPSQCCTDFNFGRASADNAPADAAIQALSTSSSLLGRESRAATLESCKVDPAESTQESLAARSSLHESDRQIQRVSLPKAARDLDQLYTDLNLADGPKQNGPGSVGFVQSSRKGQSVRVASVRSVRSISHHTRSTDESEVWENSDHSFTSCPVTPRKRETAFVPTPRRERLSSEGSRNSNETKRSDEDGDEDGDVRSEEPPRATEFHQQCVAKQPKDLCDVYDNLDLF